MVPMQGSLDENLIRGRSKSFQVGEHIHTPRVTNPNSTGKIGINKGRNAISTKMNLNTLEKLNDYEFVKMI